MKGWGCEWGRGAVDGVRVEGVVGMVMVVVVVVRCGEWWEVKVWVAVVVMEEAVWEVRV